MAVRFILGRSGTGKTHACIEAVCDALVQNPSSPTPLILLVPEQATFQMERAVLSHAGILGFSRLRILSFDRLLFHLLGPKAGASELSRAGQQILLQRLLGQMGDDLYVFGQVAQEPGMATALAGLIAELQHYGQGPRDVDDLLQRLGESQDTGATLRKFKDLGRLYQAYLTAVTRSGHPLLNPEIRSVQIQEALKQAQWLQGGHLWIDGFAGFTGQEMNLLAGLLPRMSQIDLALCLDPDRLDLNNRILEDLDPHSLFAASERTYVQLLQICDRFEMTIDSPSLLHTGYRFSDSQDLAHLEQSFLAPQVTPQPPQGQIELRLAPHRRAEVDFIARDIASRVQQQGLRYRDLSVVVSDMEGYHHLLEAAFDDAGIPFFLDRAKTFCQHPLVEALGAALQCIQSGWATRDVLAYLKTGLGPLPDRDIYRLENAVLALGFEGLRWLSSQPWDPDQPELDVLRQKATADLKRLYYDLTDQGQPRHLSAAEFVASLWQWIERLAIPKTLAQWSQDDPADCSGHRQLMDKLVHLLDEMVAILGDEPLPSDQLRRILIQALGQLTCKHIPPTLDQVMIGSIERSRHPDIKVLYVVGATQRQFPMPVTFDTLLTEQDRALAESQEFLLADSLSQRLVGRQYLAYIAFTRASEALVITVPAVHEDGSAVVPSPLVDALQQLFIHLTWIPTDFVEAPLATIYSSHQLALTLARNMGRDTTDGTDPQWQDTLLWFRNHDSPSLQGAADAVSRALVYDNQAGLTADLAHRLQGDTLLCSASRLSCFAACPYQHFARYGLCLEPRDTIQMEPVDVGNLYHDVLERLHHQLKEQDLHLGNVDPERLQVVLDQCFDAVVAESPSIQRFVEQSPHHGFVLGNARQSLHDCVIELAEMTRAGQFVPLAAELDFGPDATLPPVVVTDKQGRSIQVRGRIDRLDTLTTEHGAFALVMDYKRTPRSFSWPKFLYGLDLQLPLYLLAVTGTEVEGQQIQQAVGAFMLPIEVATPTGSFDQTQPTRFKRKGKGLFHGDFEEALETVESSSWSRYWSFYKAKDGLPYSYFKTSPVLHPEQFDWVQAYCRQLIRDLGTRLFDGDIQVAPYRLGTQSPCSFCDYRALCKFDWQINDYRILDSCNKEEALQQMGGEQ